MLLPTVSRSAADEPRPGRKIVDGAMKILGKRNIRCRLRNQAIRLAFALSIRVNLVVVCVVHYRVPTVGRAHSNLDQSKV